MKTINTLRPNFVFERDYSDGSLINDIQGGTGFLVGSAVWINSSRGKSIRTPYNGVSASGLLYSSAAYAITSGTIIAMISRNKILTGIQEIIYRTTGYNLYFNGDAVGMYDYSGGTGFMTSGVSITDLKPHVVVIKFENGANGVKFWVDGIAGNTDTWTIGANSPELKVGYGADAFLSGGADIHYVAISTSTTITNEQIAELSAELLNKPFTTTLSKRNFTYPSPAVEPSIRYSAEKLVDGDMEAVGTTAWTAGQNGLLTKETQSDGSKVLRVAYNGTAAPSAYQFISTVGKTYRIKGRMRSDGTQLPRIVNFSTLLWTGTTSTSWQYFDFNFTAIGGTSVVFYHAGSTGYIEVDNVSVKEDTLVGQWDMMQNNGSYADMSAGGNNLTKVGQAGEVNGLFERATQFDGVSGYLTKTVADFRSADSLGSISAMIKINALGVAQIIFSSSDTASATQYLAFYVSTANKLTVTSVVGATVNTVTSTNTLRTGEWYKVYLTSNDTAWKLSVNGVAETLVVATGANLGTWFADITGRDNIVIGALKHTSVSNFFNGQINSVKIYSKELSATEDLNDYNRIANKLIYRNTFEDAQVTLGTSSVDLNGFTPISGTHKISEDTTKKKWLGNVTVGTVFSGNEQAYGTFQADFYLTASGQTLAWNFANTKLDGSGNGYRLTVSGTGGIYLARITAGGSATQAYSALGYIALNTKYQIRVTRSHIGVCSFYVRGGAYTTWTLVSVVGGGGANPITDNTHTTSLYQNITTSVANGGKISNMVVFEGVLDPTTYPEII